VNPIKLVRILLSMLLLDAASVPEAWGCGADPFAALRGPAFEVDFKKPDPQWPVNGNTIYFADGQLVVKGEPGRTAWSAIDAFRFNNAVFCVDVKMPPDREPPSGTAAGLLFGKTDNVNYFVTLITPEGTWLLHQLVNNSWKRISDGRVPERKFNRGPGAVNEIKIKLQPAKYYATSLYMFVSINDEIVDQPNFSPLPGGGGFGVATWSSPDQISEWRFLNVTAAALSNPEGNYSVSGTYPGGASYAGTVNVLRDSYAPSGVERYHLGWEIDGQKVWGTGVVNGETFSVTYPDSVGTGVAAYAASPTGWKGHRTDPAQHDRVASETWVRRGP